MSNATRRFWLIGLIGGLLPWVCQAQEVLPLRARPYDEIISRPRTPGGPVITRRGEIRAEADDAVTFAQAGGSIAHSIPRAEIIRINRRATLQEVYREATREAGQDPEKHFFLGRRCARSNLPEQTELEFELVLTLSPKHHRAYEQLAQHHHRTGIAEKELAVLRRAARAKVRSAPLVRQLAELYLRLRLLDLAEREYMILLELLPRGRAGRVGLADVLTVRGKHREAEERYRDVLQSFPGYGRALNGLGRLAFQRGQLALAQQNFAKAAQTADRAEALTNLGVLFLSRGEPSKARGYLESALQADPTNPAAHLNLAVALGEEIPIHRERLRNLDRLLRLKPEPKAREQLEAERKALEEAVRKNPGRAEAHLLRAEKAGGQSAALYLARGHLREKNAGPPAAVDAYRRAYELDPMNAAALCGWARAAVAESRSDLARRFFQRAATLDPASPEALRGLGRAYYQAEEFASAVDAFARLVRLKKSSENFYRLGLARLRLKPTDREAADLFLEATRSNRLDPFPYLGLGYLMVQHGNLLSARDLFTTARKSGDPTGYAERALDRLYRLADWSIHHDDFQRPAEAPTGDLGGGWYETEGGGITIYRRQGRAYLAGRREDERNPARFSKTLPAKEFGAFLASIEATRAAGVTTGVFLGTDRRMFLFGRTADGSLVQTTAGFNEVPVWKALATPKVGLHFQMEIQMLEAGAGRIRLYGGELPLPITELRVPSLAGAEEYRTGVFVWCPRAEACEIAVLFADLLRKAAPATRPAVP